MVGLLTYSALIYDRFTLGIDFSIYYQAVDQISHGHLDPYSTIVGYPFIESHFELIVWPLSLLLLVFRSPFVILAVQDLSLVGTGVLAVLWVPSSSSAVNSPIERLPCADHDDGDGSHQSAGVLHRCPGLPYRATATFFAGSAAFDIWSGRHRRAAIWWGCVCCAALGGIYVVGVGLSAALASPSTRKIGLLSILAGVTWVGVSVHSGPTRVVRGRSICLVAGRSLLPPGSLARVAVHGVLAHPEPAARSTPEPEDPDRDLPLARRSDRHRYPMGPGRPAAGAPQFRMGDAAMLSESPTSSSWFFRPCSLAPCRSSRASRHLNRRSPSDPGLEAHPPAWWAITVLVSIGILACSAYFAAHRIPESFRDNGVAAYWPHTRQGCSPRY